MPTEANEQPGVETLTGLDNANGTVAPENTASAEPLTGLCILETHTACS